MPGFGSDRDDAWTILSHEAKERFRTCWETVQSAPKPKPKPKPDRYQASEELSPTRLFPGAPIRSRPIRLPLLIAGGLVVLGGGVIWLQVLSSDDETVEQGAQEDTSGDGADRGGAGRRTGQRGQEII